MGGPMITSCLSFRDHDWHRWKRWNTRPVRGKCKKERKRGEEKRTNEWERGFLSLEKPRPYDHLMFSSVVRTCLWFLLPIFQYHLLAKGTPLCQERENLWKNTCRYDASIEMRPNASPNYSDPCGSWFADPKLANEYLAIVRTLINPVRFAMTLTLIYLYDRILLQHVWRAFVCVHKCIDIF